MAPKNRRRAELEALAAEIAGLVAAPRGSADADGRAEPSDSAQRHDFEKLLHDVEETLAAAAEDLEHIVVSHPLAALAAGVLLGIVIGRVLRRS
jgi:hypothetical protein